MKKNNWRFILGVIQPSLDWRERFGGEPNIEFRRKKDGIYEILVTQPTNTEPGLPILNTQPPVSQEQLQEGIAPTSAQKDECTETPKKQWIIKEAKANDNKIYQLIGKECDKFCGIFIEKKATGILSKIASKKNIIDFEKVDKIGDTWRENINESAWISKFDSYINSIK